MECLYDNCAEADGALDKARKHKKRQLEDTLNLVLKKRKVMTNFYYSYIESHNYSLVSIYEPFSISA